MSYEGIECLIKSMNFSCINKFYKFLFSCPSFNHQEFPYFSKFDTNIRRLDCIPTGTDISPVIGHSVKRAKKTNQVKIVYVLEVGYNGVNFFGYQQQNSDTYLTVEGVISSCFGHSVAAAGRTDKVQ